MHLKTPWDQSLIFSCPLSTETNDDNKPDRCVSRLISTQSNMWTLKTFLPQGHGITTSLKRCHLTVDLLDLTFTCSCLALSVPLPNLRRQNVSQFFGVKKRQKKQQAHLSVCCGVFPPCQQLKTSAKGVIQLETKALLSCCVAPWAWHSYQKACLRGLFTNSASSS